MSKGMRLGLVTTTFGGEANFLDTKDLRYITGGATIEAAKVSDGFKFTENGVTYKIVPPGVPMAKVGTKYCPAKNTELKTATAAGTDVVTFESAKAFQAGDTVLVGATPLTIKSIDYATNIVTFTTNSGTVVAIGAAVVATGAIAAQATPAFLCTDECDVTVGDCVVTGIDHGRVLTARLPLVPSAAVKTALPGIFFR